MEGNDTVQHKSSSKPADCTSSEPTHPQRQPMSKKGGRPVTWIGGGGLNASFVAGKGVPELRALFLEVFGHPTASNNSAWLRRKLSEPPDATFGRGRSAKIRRRDVGAAIWTTGNVTTFSQAEAAVMVQSRCASLSGDTKTPSATPVKQCHYSSDVEQELSVSVHRKRQRACRTSALDHLIKQLKEVACPDDWISSPPSVEVFWPEASGGSWWQARVLKVMPKKATCSVLYDTSEIEELDLKEMLALDHIRLISPRAQNGCAGEEFVFPNLSDVKSETPFSITDAVCNSVKSDMERTNHTISPTAVSVEDSEEEQMIRTIAEPITYNHAPAVAVADSSCEVSEQFSANVGLQSFQLLAPLKPKPELANLPVGPTNVYQVGGDTSGWSFSSRSPFSETLCPTELEGFSAPDMTECGLSLLPQFEKGPRNRGNVCSGIFDDDFISTSFDSLIDEEASSYDNMIVRNHLPSVTFCQAGNHFTPWS